MSTTRRAVLFCLDASATIGMGHLNRCLVLAGRLAKKGFGSVFTECSSSRANELIKDQGYDVVRFHELSVSSLAEKSVSLVLFDLLFDQLEQVENHLSLQSLKKVHLYTDVHAARGNEELIIYPNIDHFNANGVGHAMVGWDYIMINDSVAAEQPRHADRIERILISMGGSDPANHTLAVMNALRDIPRVLDLRVIIGPGYSHETSSLTESSAHQVSLVHDPPNMARELQSCQLAIVPGGITRFELAYLGIPMLLTPFNELQFKVNQQFVDHFQVNYNFRLEKPEHLASFQSIIRHMEVHQADLLKFGRAMTGIVDGRGAERIAGALVQQIEDHVAN